MKKTIATLVMGLLLALTVISVSAQQTDMKQSDNMSGQKMMKRHRHHRRHHHKHHRHHHHKMMMKKAA